LALLRELDAVYKDHRYPNLGISKVLTTKTVDQIKYQRRKLKASGEDEIPQGGTQVAEGGYDPVASGNARQSDPESSGVNDDESTLEWRLAIAKAIDEPTEVPPALREVHGDLMKIWNNYRGNGDALGIELNKFISISLYGAIKKNMKNEATGFKPIAKGKKPSYHTRRNAKKRYSYARCQVL
jgi:hypothetical protein